jgi:hypothetical protein
MSETKVNLYAVYGITHTWEDEPFDESALPARIVPNVTIESVSSMFTESSFDLFAASLSPDDLKSLRAVKYAVVERFQRKTTFHGEEEQKFDIGQTIYSLAACLRLIRPMRQFAMRIHGVLKDDGTLDVGGFDHPVHLMEVPAIQKDFRLRNRDIQEFQALAPQFQEAMAGEHWKFRMPLSLHDAAHFIDNEWKARMSLMCSAIEAIYTSQTPDRQHSGSRVAKARIKWFLGESTSIYAPGDVQSFSRGGKEPTLADVLDDLYTVRNCIAHGDRVPDKYFLGYWSGSPYGSAQANFISVLEEAASFVVRASLLKILKDDLLHHFKDGPESQAYFASYSLVRSNL